MDEPTFDLILVAIYDERWILAGEGGERVELPAPLRKLAPLAAMAGWPTQRPSR